MKHKHAVTAMAVLVFAGAQTPVFGQGAIIWADEFDGTTLDTNNWEPMIGDGCSYGVCNWGNNELQYYTARPENLFVSGGYLHIIAREEAFGGYSYTSARLRTLNMQEFLYGRMEARIRIPQGQGIWPAFWMLPTNSPYGGWASSGEIDIMEAVNVPWNVHGTLHFGGGWPANTSAGSSYSTGVNFADAFHNYAIEWEEDEMRWYVDNNHFLTLTSSQWWSDAAPSNPRAPFDSPFHFLLNVAVGGNWPGPPDGSTVFPQEMLVDWVRVYDLNNMAPTVAIDTPTDGASLPVGNVVFSATAADSDGSIDRVEFYANTTLIDQDTTQPYSVTWSATDGCYDLRAVAVDDFGAMTTDSIDVTVGAGCVGIPYHGSPALIPGVIELEDFDLGGEGVAYHDCDAGNSGGAYRPSEGVDIEAASEGGHNVGWMCAGEWLNFAVDVEQAGTYKVSARVASQDNGGVFRLELDGADKTGNVVVPPTGGWQDWTNVFANAQVSAGVQQLRFVNLGDSSEQFNISSITFTRLEDLDYDVDGDVDLADWFIFVRCMSAPGVSTPQSTCSPEDFDRSDVDNDNDVDLEDFAAFQRARTAP